MVLRRAALYHDPGEQLADAGERAVGHDRLVERHTDLLAGEVRVGIAQGDHHVLEQGEELAATLVLLGVAELRAQDLLGLCIAEGRGSGVVVTPGL